LAETLITMKKNLLNLLLLALSAKSIAQISSIHTLPLASNIICASNFFTVSFTTNGNANPGNQFWVQISSKNGSFANPQVIGSLTSQTAGTINCAVTNLIEEGTKYRVRVVSTDPLVTGTNNGSNITIHAYCGIPENVTTGSLTSGSALITWSPPYCNVVTNYKIRYRVNGTSSAYTVVNSPVTQKTLSGLSPLITYEYSVRTYISSFIGQCKWSPAQIFTTHPLRNAEEVHNDANTREVTLSPNPAANEIMLSILRKGKEQHGEIIVLNSTGKEVFRQQLYLAADKNIYKIKTLDFPDGIYIAKIIFDSDVLNKQFIVQH
jgi:hypothetical protein